MKILIIGSYDKSLINFRGDLIRTLVSRNHQVIAAAPEISDDIRTELEKLGALVESTPLSRAGLNPITDYFYYRSIKSIIFKHNPDLLLTYTAKPNIWGSFAAWYCKIKSISMVTGLGYAFVPNGTRKQQFIKLIVSTLYRITTSLNNAVIFQNMDDLNEFVENGCLSDTSKSHQVNGSGINLLNFSKMDLPPDPVFLLIARLLISKGIREYVGAAKIVRQEVPEARFLLAGYIDEGQDGISEVELLTYKDAGIEYLGELTDVRPAIEMASVYVLPSYREGTPRTVLEAMAMGRPIVTTNVPGCKETTVDNVNGYLVPAKDMKKLADRMIKLAKQANKRELFGNRSREIAEKKFAVKKINDKIINLIETI